MNSYHKKHLPYKSDMYVNTKLQSDGWHPWPWVEAGLQTSYCDWRFRGLPQSLWANSRITTSYLIETITFLILFSSFNTTVLSYWQHYQSINQWALYIQFPTVSSLFGYVTIYTPSFITVFCVVTEDKWYHNSAMWVGAECRYDVYQFLLWILVKWF